ncbi:MAG: nuclear transport factor 2 family protein [Anaerolineaceae bacterium]|nr:nuclear transport factor 2 family protein [Anaerolineaceae bacterium]
MNTKRIVFILSIIFAVALAACGGTAVAPQISEQPTQEPAATAAATPAPKPMDAITVAQNFLDARGAGDLETVSALLAEDVRWRGTPYLTGKGSVMTYIEADIDSGFTSEISDIRATRGRVTYSWTAYKNGVFYGSGEDTIVVENGLVAAIESYTALGSDSRPDIAEAAFTASDAGFSGPEEITGGWVKISLANEGHEPYHIQLVRLDAGKSLEDLKAALTANPEIYPAWAEPFGGPNAPDPGGWTAAIVYLAPGSYALIDLIPNAEGVPHFQNGMMKALTVTEPDGIIAGEPLPDVTIALNDFAFFISEPLAAGEQTIRFLNRGTQVHEAFLVRLEDGKTADDYLNTPPGAISPGASLGGITGIVPGDGQYVPVTLEPGTYVLFCFLPDSGSHAPHFALGMMQEIAIK